ncbi:MAG: MFS transporter [Bacillota bacterium]|jgi:predicted MFS family arabinose efflux permease
MDSEKRTGTFSKAFLFIAVGALLLQMGTGIQSTVFSNFVSDEIGIGADQLGLISGIREVPGLMTAALAMAALLFTESVLATICMLLVAAGMLLYSGADGFGGLVLATIVMSVGQHLYFPLQSAMVLKTSASGERASRLGSLNSVTALATVTATLMVRAMTGQVSMRAMFRVGAAIAVCGAVFQALVKRGGKANLRKALVFKWKYKSYYVLSLLGGSRRHMNQTFAIFALVNLYGVNLATISTLLLISNVIAILTRPMLGKLIDRWGEGKSLTLNYTVVAVLFLGYAFVRNIGLLYAIFIIDQMFLGFEVAITTHLDKICDQNDISASLAMGGTISHISAVLIPMIGGFLWDAISPIATFMVGFGLCIISLLQAYYLPSPESIRHQQVA